MFEKGVLQIWENRSRPLCIFNRPENNIKLYKDTYIQSPTLNVVLGFGGLLEMMNLSLCVDEG